MNIRHNVLLVCFLCCDAGLKAVMSYEGVSSASLTTEEVLAQLNSLYLHLSLTPDDIKSPLKLKAAFIEWSMDTWIKMVFSFNLWTDVVVCVAPCRKKLTQEKVANEAIRLRKVFGIPEMETSVDGTQKTVLADAGEGQTFNTL